MITGGTPMAHSITPGIPKPHLPRARIYRTFWPKQPKSKAYVRKRQAVGGWCRKKNMRGFNHVQASTDISGYNMIHQSSTDISGYDTVNDGCFFSWELGGFFSVKPWWTSMSWESLTNQHWYTDQAGLENLLKWPNGHGNKKGSNWWRYVNVPYVWPYEFWGYSLKFRPELYRPYINGRYLQCLSVPESWPLNMMIESFLSYPCQDGKNPKQGVVTCDCRAAACTIFDQGQ